MLRCIKSVDIDAEVIVSYTGSKELAGQIEAVGARCIYAPSGNLSRVSNVGFAASSAPNVLITDSDTTFEEGCITLLLEALESHMVARARLLFDSTDNRALSRIVANARDFVNRLPLVFTPGIAVRKDLLPDVGGFLFNDPVPYAVDADLDFRIRQGRVPVAFIPEARVHHGPISLRHDMRAAYRIGMGSRVSIAYWNRDGRYGVLRDDTLKAVRPRHLPIVLRQMGAATLAYQLAWDAAYWTGYFISKRRGVSPSQAPPESRPEKPSGPSP